MFSYNNAGFVVLGRLVEVLRGKPYDECLARAPLRPAGPDPRRDRALRGDPVPRGGGSHRAEPDADPCPAPMWALVRSNVPPGRCSRCAHATCCAFARDAPERRQGRRRHPGPARPRAVAAMHAGGRGHAARLGLMGTHWGLGFELFDTPDGTIVGHDGSTIGQSRSCGSSPRPGRGGRAADQRRRHVLALPEVIGSPCSTELADIDLPALPVPPETRERSTPAGTSARTPRGRDLVVTQDDDGRIWIDETPKGIAEEIGEKAERKELVHYAGDTPDPRRARPRHAHAACLRRRRRRGPCPLPPRRPCRPAGRGLTP